MLECIEKSWIYTKDYDNPTEFIWANERGLEALIEMLKLINPPKEMIEEFLNSIYYRHLTYLKNKI